MSDIKFQFIKETDVVIKNAYEYYTNLLQKVETYLLEIGNRSFEVSFDFQCTMIDEKVCNVLTEQKATTCCNICRYGPKFMNDLKHILNHPCNKEFYKFGLSRLHVWICFLEYLLHVAYNMDLKKSIV